MLEPASAGSFRRAAHAGRAATASPISHLATAVPRLDAIPNPSATITSPPNRIMHMSKSTAHRRGLCAGACLSRKLQASCACGQGSHRIPQARQAGCLRVCICVRPDVGWGLDQQSFPPSPCMAQFDSATF